MNEPIASLLRRALAAVRGGGRVHACLVVTARGSTPQTAGALMLVDDAAGAHGTIGGGCVEAEVRRQAFHLLSRGESALLRLRLNHDYGWDDGLICGGTIEIACAPLDDAHALERAIAAHDAGQPASLALTVRAASAAATYALNIAPRERLYIAGAGHVGQALVRLAGALEFEVTVFDDRADLLAVCARAGARPVAGDIARSLREAPVDARTFAVIVTRGHRHDEQALHALVGRGARYLGMIGSRRKVKLIFDDLRALGVPDAHLAAVRAPIGLDIGAVSVEEIAVSIAAELVRERRTDRAEAVTCSGSVEAVEAAPA